MTKTLFLSVMLFAACHGDSNAKSQPSATTLPDLTTTLDAVRAEFNAHKAEPQFGTLLSAT